MKTSRAKQRPDRLSSAVDPTRLAAYQGLTKKTPSMGELNRVMMARSQDIDDLKERGEENLSFGASLALNEIVLTIAATPALSATERQYKLGLLSPFAVFASDRGHRLVAGMILAAERIEVARQEVGGESTTAH